MTITDGPTTTPTPSPSTPAPSPSAVACTSPLGLTLDRTIIFPGTAVGVTVTAPAGSAVQLQAYSRPVTKYSVARSSIVPSSGTVTYQVTPGTNTRLFATCVGQTASESPSQVINVRTALSLTVVRNGKRDYTFQGRILPRRAGQLITLYRITSDGTRVLTSQIKTDSTGTYRIPRKFTGSGTFGFLTRTGQNLTNQAGESNTDRANVEDGTGKPRPTAIF